MNGRRIGGRGPRVLVRSAASAAVLILVGAGWASPAGAHADADEHGTISLSATGDLGSPPAVSGTLFGLSALGLGIETINAIELTATPIGPTGGGQIGADGCAMVTSGRCESNRVSFHWQLPGLAYNGPYVVNAIADHCLLGCGPATVTPQEFRLAADPATPADVRAEAGADRNVILSWARNGEPDLLYYEVSRKTGGGNFTRIGGDVHQPASGRPAFVDTSTSGTPGGEFAYRVVAVRNGPSGDDSTTRTSGASGEKSVAVPPPPEPAAPPGTPGAEAKPAGSDTNIGGYLAGQPGALGSPKPMFLDLPDTGFDGSLPFGQFPGEDMSEPGEEDAIKATMETRRLEAFNRGRPLIPIAAGAILLLLAAHLRLFNKKLKGDVPDRRNAAARFIATLDASKQAAMPLDVEAAVANGGHHRPPSGADLTDLPEWGSFRGVTLLPSTPTTNGDAGDGDTGDEEWADERGAGGMPVTGGRHEASADGEALDRAEDDQAFAEPEQHEQDEEDDEDWEVIEPAVVLDEEEEEHDFLLELEEDDYLAEVELAEVELGEVEPAPADEVLVGMEHDEAGDEDEDEDWVLDQNAMVEDDELVAEVEPDEMAEIVSLLVPASGPVATPSVNPEPEPEPAVAELDVDVAEPDIAAAAGTNGSRELTDFDDFEWSEEAQFAEPEIEVVVAPRVGGKKLARARR